MEVSVRYDKHPQPFTLRLDGSVTVEELLSQICKQIQLETYCMEALVVKRGFPPRPVELVKEQTLSQAAFSAREKLVVSLEDEMAEKLRAEHYANMTPL